MSLITVSALVNADTSFAFQPYGLPQNKTISVYKVASIKGMYQIIYDTVFASTPVVTVTQAWLGSLGGAGGLTIDNATINEITKTYATVKMGDGNGNGQWRPFTIVLTGYQNVTNLKEPETEEDANIEVA